MIVSIFKTKTLFLTCLLVCISLPDYAQSSPDSLQQALVSAQQDTQKITLLIKLGELMIDEDIIAASDYLDEGFELAERLNDSASLYKLGMAFNLLGATYADQGDFVSGKKYYFKSLDVFQSLEKPYGVATISANLGDIYLEEDSNALAERYYQQAIVVLEQAGDRESYLQVQLKRGINLSEQRKYRSLSRLLEPLEKEIAGSADMNMKQTLYALLSDANAERKRFASAYTYSVKAAMVSDSVLTAELYALEERMRAEYEEKTALAEDASPEVSGLSHPEKDEKLLQLLILAGVFSFVMLAIIVVQAVKIRSQKRNIEELEA